MQTLRDNMLVIFLLDVYENQLLLYKEYKILYLIRPNKIEMFSKTKYVNPVSLLFFGNQYSYLLYS